MIAERKRSPKIKKTVKKSKVVFQKTPGNIFEIIANKNIKP
ncbi:hypothetical protein LEP1GSC047_4230 [Leptospira inadai serovar Lyme str. 10]|uniref:Uncharacterized protein n=1 Tax=Leptospira inadai serovar Lyme str. 10 TaxID=1049790 RepID=V6HDC4_9LEPT|nr:hypothetical protein LEP1GSC047_4230 [Leptospira inadai serovar Lyme str. 10]